MISNHYSFSKNYSQKQSFKARFVPGDVKRFEGNVKQLADEFSRRHPDNADFIFKSLNLRDDCREGLAKTDERIHFLLYNPNEALFIGKNSERNPKRVSIHAYYDYPKGTKIGIKQLSELYIKLKQLIPRHIAANKEFIDALKNKEKIVTNIEEIGTHIKNLEAVREKLRTNNLTEAQERANRAYIKMNDLKLNVMLKSTEQ